MQVHTTLDLSRYSMEQLQWLISNQVITVTELQSELTERELDETYALDLALRMRAKAG